MAQTELPESLSPDDALPPVEPPSAGFLVQLFLIPGIIVAIIVMVWMMFQWLAHVGNDPRKYVEALRGHGEQRWQAALNLAGALNSPEAAELRADPEVARELGRLLQDEVKQGASGERQVNLRQFLCMALGQFSTDAGLPALLDAATARRNASDDAVRLAALKGIGDLAENVRGGGGTLANNQLMPTLLEASSDEQPEIRAAATLALGAVGNSEAEARLLQMLDDENVAIRYDAALAVAERGDPKALETLIEMLDDDQDLALRAANDPQRRKVLIQVKALQGIRQIHKNHPDADFSRAEEAAERLTESESPEVRDNALNLKRQFRETPEAAEAP